MTISQPKGYSMFCAKEKLDLDQCPTCKTDICDHSTATEVLLAYHKVKAHAQRLADACKLWHKASLQPEGSKAQAQFGNSAALASREALAQYNKGK